MDERNNTMEAPEVVLNIDSDAATRKGVFADLAMVMTNGSIARIDFISGDLPSEESVGAVLTSRIYMPINSLLDIRNQIDRALGMNAGADIDRP